MAALTNISILGCGWYGRALAKALLNKGYHVKGSTTSTQKLAELAADGIAPFLANFTPGTESYESIFFDSDVLIIAIPPKSRGGEGAVYVQKVQSIINAVKEHGIKKIIYISSTAVYADINAAVDELSEPRPDTDAGKILLEAEELLQAETTFNTTIIRFAGLIGPGRHPGRFFAGKKNIANGLAPVNLIHLDDCIGLSLAILDQQAFGYVINGCSPQHPTRKDFYTQAAIDAGLELPEFIEELREWKVVKSLNAMQVLGYEFGRELKVHSEG